ncbi:MAG: ankyrin repeat domain-containing protein [Myxococcota bacterium]
MEELLTAGCLGYDQRDGPQRREAAAAMLAALGDQVNDDIFVSAMLGRASAVAALLARDPELATTVGGPRAWPPLLYATYARLDARRDGETYVGVVTALLDAGGDPNAYWLWDGTYRFTAITGCFGEGEGGPRALPEHVECLPLARLLLRRGADPNDGQALYNRMFTTGSTCLQTLLDAGLSPTDRINWPVDSPSERTTMSYQLFHAVRQGYLERVEMLLRAGASLSEREDGASLWRAAMLAGQPEAATRLVTAGAVAEPLNVGEQFVAVFRAGDIVAAERLAAADPGLLDAVERDHGDLLADAAASGDVVALRFLVAQGVDLNRNAHTPAAHQAAYHGRVEALEFLLDAGADPRRLDARFKATALGWAQHAGQAETAAVLVARGL